MGVTEYELVESTNRIMNVADIGRDFKFLREPFTDNSCALVGKGSFSLIHDNHLLFVNTKPFSANYAVGRLNCIHSSIDSDDDEYTPINLMRAAILCFGGIIFAKKVQGKLAMSSNNPEFYKEVPKY